MSNEVQIFNQNNIVAAFENKGGLDDLFSRMEKEAKSLVPDLTTDKGRKAIAAQAHKVSKAKVLVDDHGKELVSAEKARLALIDADRKSWRDRCDALRDEIRAPLTAWEAAEKSRIARHEANLNWFELRTSDLAGLDSSELQLNMAECESKAIDESWQEFAPQAAVAKDKALNAMRLQLTIVQKQEAEQAELTRLRQEAIEREQQERERKIAEDAANKARLEAEQKAAAERAEQARKEAENIAKAEQAKRDAEQAKINAELEQARLVAEAEAAKLREAESLRLAEQAKIEALAKAKADQEAAIESERKRVEQERINAEQAEAKRLKDVEHVRGINQSIVADLLTHGITEDQARSIIKAIAKNAIKNVSIQY